MGPKRLIAVALAMTACSHAPLAAPPETPIHPAHFQVVPAMKLAERRALVARFVAQNPASPSWQVNEEALALSAIVVDPFRGFVRRAFRRRAGPQGPIVDRDAAGSAARAFVRRNAELFGLPPSVALTLAEANVERITDAGNAHATWQVDLVGEFPSRGYEGFRELTNEAKITVIVDDDGEPSAVANSSSIHPHLTLDIHPRLHEGDPGLTAQIVGRRVFALAGVGDTTDVKRMRRIPLGTLVASDVREVALGVYASTGPELSWRAYRLAYAIDLVKPLGGEAFPAPIGEAHFAYLVDADTGDVLKDAEAPILPMP